MLRPQPIRFATASPRGGVLVAVGLPALLFAVWSQLRAAETSNTQSPTSRGHVAVERMQPKLPASQNAAPHRAGVARITELAPVSEAVRIAQAPPRTGQAPAAGTGRPIEEIRPQAPAAVPSEELPSPFGAEHVRLPLIGAGRTPVMSDETKRKIDRFVDAQLDTEATLNLALGRPQLLVFKQVPFRIQIADEEVANYTLITERELSVVGKKLGTTVMNLWFTDPDQPQKQEIISYLLIVIPDPEAGQRIEAVLAGLEEEINRNFPNSAVRLAFVGDRVIVRGQAKDIEDATQIIRIVGANVPDIKQDTAPFPGEDILAPDARTNSFNKSLLATGEGIDAQNAYEEYKLANEAERQALQGNNRVVNMLRIAGVHQVMLKVTVAEVDRSATRVLGANLSLGSLGTSPARFTGFFPTAPGAAQTAAAVTSGAITGVTGGSVGTGGNFLVNAGDFRLVINALKQLNLARSLNEPNLTTLNGRPATLQVGGSFPVPQTVTQGVGAQTFQSVQYVPFGVLLRFIPTVVDKDRIRLQVFATVSDRSQDTVNVGGSTSTSGGTTSTSGGTNVPSNVDTRTFNTVVELREGQTLTAAGLLKTAYTTQTQRVPLMGEVPVVGRLFANDRTFYSERELIVLVTPYLVAPYDESETPAIVGEDVFESSDIDFYVLGKVEGCRAQDFRSAVRSDIHKLEAWRRCQQDYIIGPSGHSDGRP